MFYFLEQGVPQLEHLLLQLNSLFSNHLKTLLTDFHSGVKHVLANLLDFERCVRSIGLGTRQRLKRRKWGKKWFLANAFHWFVTRYTAKVTKAGISKACNIFLWQRFFLYFWFDRFYSSVDVFLDCVYFLPIKFLPNVS